VLDCRSGLRVACGEGELELLEVQPESKRRMCAAEFLAGKPLKVGDKLGGG
jgi:methionyl-tRNA formyltransferase